MRPQKDTKVGQKSTQMFIGANILVYLVVMIVKVKHMMKQNATVEFISRVRIILGYFIQIVEYKVDDREE